MKAAVIFQRGDMPQYIENFPEPVAIEEDQIVISVRASAIKNLDKSKAGGKHYSSTEDLNHAKIPGGDGVGFLPDGTRVFALGITGMLAEKAVVDKRKMVRLPEGIDDLTAAALPNAVAGSAMALRFRAAIKAGETVLINGATGFTGNIAVQIAKHYGAGKIIVTGRNKQTLQSLLTLGADQVVVIDGNDETFASQLHEIHHSTPIDIVIDYLWGHTAELILATLKGDGSFTHKTRFVSVGSVTGDKIQLSAETLRSVDLQLSGSGLGSWTRDEMHILISEILPEMFELVVDNKLKVDTVSVNLADIEKLWEMEVVDGKRLVVVI